MAGHISAWPTAVSATNMHSATASTMVTAAVARLLARLQRFLLLRSNEPFRLLVRLLADLLDLFFLLLRGQRRV